MSITAAFVLFAVLWFLTFLCILPLRVVTQAEAGEIVPGTHAGAPANANIKHKAKLTSIVTVVLWVVLYLFLTSGLVTIRDIDFMGRMKPVTVTD